MGILEGGRFFLTPEVEGLTGVFIFFDVYFFVITSRSALDQFFEHDFQRTIHQGCFLVLLANISTIARQRTNCSDAFG